MHRPSGGANPGAGHGPDPVPGARAQTRAPRRSSPDYSGQCFKTLRASSRGARRRGWSAAGRRMPAALQPRPLYCVNRSPCGDPRSNATGQTWRGWVRGEESAWGVCVPLGSLRHGGGCHGAPDLRTPHPRARFACCSRASRFALRAARCALLALRAMAAAARPPGVVATCPVSLSTSNFDSNRGARTHRHTHRHTQKLRGPGL